MKARRIAIGAADSAAEAVARIRAAAGERPGAVIAILDPAMPQPDRAMLIAAIGPLAIEYAPRVRLALVDARHDADRADIDAVAQFLGATGSITGQVVAVG